MQSIVESKWKEREDELLRKHGIRTESASSPGKTCEKSGNTNVDKIKSPSDTTIYAPALNRTPNNKVVVPFNEMPLRRQIIQPSNEGGFVNDRVAQFVDNMRLEDEIRCSAGQPRVRSEVVVQSTSKQPEMKDKTDEAKEVTTNLILNAERFRADISQPKGMGGDSNFFKGVRTVKEGEILEDDDFFHITCHVEQSITEKISKGEFIELDKLLVKDKFRRSGSDQQRLEFVNQDGHTYLAPVNDRDTKITVYANVNKLLGYMQLSIVNSTLVVLLKSGNMSTQLMLHLLTTSEKMWHTMISPSDK